MKNSGREKINWYMVLMIINPIDVCYNYNIAKLSSTKHIYEWTIMVNKNQRHK